jgi:pyruvate/2-oxoglutarate/acetoin dehydrogenase E1 component
MFQDFITLAMDQIVNHAAKFHYMYGNQSGVPMVIRTPAGGGRNYGPTHSQSLEAWFMHVPGLKVVAPSTGLRREGASQIGDSRR